jgi:hypothetical protein
MNPRYLKEWLREIERHLGDIFLDSKQKGEQIKWLIQIS